jgi:6-phosphogluconolactonase
MGERILCYIGTYTHTTSKGIYLYELDPATGALSLLNASPAGAEPSYLAFHPNGRYLYAVSETMEYEGRPSGGVSALAIDPQSGALTLLNQVASEGGSPCYVSVDATGQFVLVANYHGGSLAVLPIRPDGRLLPKSDYVYLAPTAEEAARKKEPRGHCIILAPGNRFVLACDAGLDRVMVYQLELARGRLVPNDPPYIQLRDGAAPRHITFHPNERYAYAIGESSSTMFALAWDGARGVVTEKQAISTLPADFSGRSFCADVHVHPSGRFLYGSNRGHDSIVIYAIDQATGELTLVGHESTQGQTPRNFSLDPTGAYLYAANQRSDTVVTYHIDQATGRLTPTGQVLQIPIPVCIKFREKA